MIAEDMVEVFKTSLETAAQCDNVVQELLNYFPSNNITVDLDDCDRVLRIAGDNISCHTVVDVLKRNGYHVEVMQ